MLPIFGKNAQMPYQWKRLCAEMLELVVIVNRGMTPQYKGEWEEKCD
jgi:hypothetical protein